MQTLTKQYQNTLPPYTGFELQPIDGRWRHGKGSNTARDVNPYNRQVLLEIPQANREDLDTAFTTALRAQKKWGDTLPAERAAVMRTAATIMDARKEEIITWLINESGSTRIKATIEWGTAQSFMLEAASFPYLAEGRILPADIPGKESRVYCKPVGVVGVISPWNWPLHLSARSVAPALALGNAVVLKPASDTPVTGGLLIAKIFEEAGLPPGVLSVVIGPGSEIGDAFVTHAAPRVISFTGSTAVGRQIARLSSDAAIIKKLELELGGNCPFVVLGDADLDRAIEAAMFGKFLHQGQICIAANRFIVDNTVYDTFVERFTEQVRKLKVGDPSRPDTMIGPIINDTQLQGLMQRIGEARDSGAKQMAGGNPDGLLLPPHVFAGVKPDNKLAREEIFGPIAPIIRAQDDTDALRIANDTGYGLSSCVFTRDMERGSRFAQRLEAGMAHVNDQSVIDLPNSPFGGEKNSGIGRFNGRWAVNAFTTDQWVSVQHTPRRYPSEAGKISGLWGS